MQIGFDQKSSCHRTYETLQVKRQIPRCYTQSINAKALTAQCKQSARTFDTQNKEGYMGFPA
jgi:hypothetical protein